MVKWIIATILLFPVAEIVAFIVVAAAIGLGLALALMCATTIVGALVLRRAGRGRIARFRVAVADTDITGIEANTNGFLMVLAGLLLFLPGFLSDLIGLALLIAPLRRWCGRAFHSWASRNGPADRSVIDLAPGEWERIPDPKLQNPSEPRRRE